MDNTELRNNYAYHPATEQTALMHEQVRAACADLAEYLNELLPDGRHKALSLTFVEQAAQMANGAIAINLAPAQAGERRGTHQRRQVDRDDG